MNPLDLQGELEVHATGDDPSVTIPLAEPEGAWMNRYLALARSEDLPAQVEPRPGGVVLTVKVSADATRQAFQLLDAAVALIDRAKEDENARHEASVTAERHIRDWWSAQGG